MFFYPYPIPNIMQLPTPLLKLNQKNNLIGLLISLLVFLLFFSVVYYKYVHFGYCNWDLAGYTQLMWNLLHGHAHVSLLGINFMGDHTDFMTLVLLPFYWIAPSALILLFFKILSFSLAVLLLFNFVKKELGVREAVIISLLYIIFPTNVFAILYDYNIENHAPIFLFAMWIFYEKNDLKRFLLAALGACLIKESMPLIVLMFGVHAFIFKKKDKLVWSTIPLAIGAFLFFMFSFVIIPYFRGTHVHTFWLRYAHIGHTPWEVFVNLLNPWVLFPTIFTPMNLSYLFSLFGLIFPFMILGLDALIMIFPILMYHILSSHTPEHSIFFYYGLTFSPFIFIALVKSLKKMKGILKPFNFSIFLIIMLVLGILNVFSYKNEILKRIDYHNDHLSNIRWEMVNSVPKNTGIVASFDFLAELSGRKDLYAFYKVYDDLFQDPKKLNQSELSQGKPFSVGANVEYALIDFKDPWLIEAIASKRQAIEQRISFFLKDFVPIKQRYSIVLYKRKK